MPNKIIYYTELVDKLINGEYVPPITFEIDPSDNCPLSCDFCLYKRGREDGSQTNNLSWEVYQKAVVEIKNMGVKSITFTGGGEPLMNPRFNNMARLANLLGFKTGLITNGVRLRSLPHDILRQFTFIRISLNAGSKETYKAITGKNKFDEVVKNSRFAIAAGASVGWSYVVDENNKHDIEKAVELSKEVNVKYIQFKPSIFSDGTQFDDYKISGKKVIDMKRYSAEDRLPCLIAHLVGVLGANGHLYYCCQYRDNWDFDLGDVAEHSVQWLWKKRMEMKPDISKCPKCRYMNYAKGYQQLVARRDVFFNHKEFL